MIGERERERKMERRVYLCLFTCLFFVIWVDLLCLFMGSNAFNVLKMQLQMLTICSSFSNCLLLFLFISIIYVSIYCLIHHSTTQTQIQGLNKSMYLKV